MASVGSQKQIIQTCTNKCGAGGSTRVIINIYQCGFTIQFDLVNIMPESDNQHLSVPYEQWLGTGCHVGNWRPNYELEILYCNGRMILLKS